MVKKKFVVVEKKRKEKAESTGNTLRRERGWAEPSIPNRIIVTIRGCVCQEIFERGRRMSGPARVVVPGVAGGSGAWVCGGVF